MPFFAPNLGTGGRIVRGLTGLLLLGGAILAFEPIPWLALLLGVSAVFVLFEALRGWCVLRACGIKTKL
jgi:hypothetical protein